MCQLTDATAQSRAVGRRRSARRFLTPWKAFFLTLILCAVGNFYFAYRIVFDPGAFFPLIENMYDFNTIFLPILCFTFGILALIQFHRERSGRWGMLPVILCWLIGVTGAGFRVYATHIEPYQLQLRTVSLESAKIKRPIRILHVSDIQSPEVGEYERRAFERFRTLEPDLILHTGDLLQLPAGANAEAERKRMAALWDTLDPTLGKFNVFGDTDRWMRRFPSRGVGDLCTLDAEDVIVGWQTTRLRIFGLRLEQSRDPTLARRIVDRWLARADPEEFTILMGHSPEFILGVKDTPIDLCLAGHTHGGQIRLPLLGPLVTSSGVPRSMARGFFRVGETRANVSAGVGCEHACGIPPIRFNCPPEMTVIELVPRERSTDSTD